MLNNRHCNRLSAIKTVVKLGVEDEKLIVIIGGLRKVGCRKQWTLNFNLSESAFDCLQTT